MNSCFRSEGGSVTASHARWRGGRRGRLEIPVTALDKSVPGTIRLLGSFVGVPSVFTRYTRCIFVADEEPEENRLNFPLVLYSLLLHPRTTPDNGSQSDRRPNETMDRGNTTRTQKTLNLSLTYVHWVCMWHMHDSGEIPLLLIRSCILLRWFAACRNSRPRSSASNFRIPESSIVCSLRSSCAA